MKMVRVMFWSVIVISVGLLSLVGAGGAWAATANDSILSQHIKEADGTSGQNTNSGSGVKTGHIQDGAVTTGKIAAGAVGNAKIADGAATDAKIAGPISASKISSTGLNADTVDGMHASDLAPAAHTHSQSQVTGLEAALTGKSDVTHNHDVLYQQKYGKVAVVARTGGDYPDPTTAMNDRATWCGTPSTINPCLLKIMPGIYNSGIQMIDYVDIEGAGENVTKLIGSTIGSSNAEMRFLTLELSAGMMGNLFVCNNSTTGTTKLTNVTLVDNATGSTSAISNCGQATVLTNVNISVSGSGPSVLGIDAGGAYALNNVKINVANASSSSAWGTIGVQAMNASFDMNNVSNCRSIY